MNDLVNAICPEPIDDLNKKNNDRHSDIIRSGKPVLEPKNVYSQEYCCEYSGTVIILKDNHLVLIIGQYYRILIQ